MATATAKALLVVGGGLGALLALSRSAGGSTSASRPAGSSSTPRPSSVPRKKPTAPPPETNNLRALAQEVADDIGNNGSDYNRELLKEFQRAAMIDDDGKYGLVSRDALFKAGIKDPPPAQYARKPVKPGGAPKGVVTLGPITTIRTDPKSGAVDTFTTDEGMTPADQAAWDLAHPEDDKSWSELLTDEQAEAIEQASIAQARARQPGASLSTMERARIAAEKAKALMSRANVAPIPEEDFEELPSETPMRTAPIASIPSLRNPPAAPINLELARREAPAVASHITKKGKAYSKQMVRDFQRHAGLNPDGAYGPMTASALRHFGVVNPPAPTHVPKSGDMSAVYYVPAGYDANATDGYE